MDDPGPVAVRQGIQYSGGELKRTGGHDLAAVAQHLPQGHALDKLHHDVGHHHVRLGVAFLTGVVDGDDVRVIQTRRRLGLATEPGLEGGVAGQVDAQAFDGDVTNEPQVAGPPHLRHAATPNDLVELITPAQQGAALSHRTGPFG